MKEKVIQFIKKYDMLVPGDGVLVAVSGGPDSVCLLHILKSLEKSFHLRLRVVHINHLLRGEDSDADERYVRDLCQKWNIPHTIQRVDVAGLSKEMGVSLEAAGREARYQAFYQSMEEYNLSKAALGQHRDDNAETILMRILRGTGPNGLMGIPPHRGDGFIRPLLSCTRREIQDYCRVHQLNPRIDQSNLEPLFFRNKIRLEVIPYLEQYNGQLKTNLQNMSLLIREQQEYIHPQMADLWEKNIKIQGGEILLPIHWFENITSFEKKEMLRRSIKWVKKNLKDMEYTHISIILDMMEKKENTTWVLQLPEEIRVERQYQSLIIKRDKVDTLQEFQYPLEIGSCIYIPELHMDCRIYLEKREEVGIIKSNPVKGHFDYSKVGDRLVIRNRRAGDTFYPSGGPGSKKLKDFFIDLKIPQEKRDRIPIIANPDHIIWVAGFRVDERAIVDQSTQDVLTIEFKHKEEQR